MNGKTLNFHVKHFDSVSYIETTRDALYPVFTAVMRMEDKL